jgi:hypothetical protein
LPASGTAHGATDSAAPAVKAIVPEPASSKPPTPDVESSLPAKVAVINFSVKTDCSSKAPIDFAQLAAQLSKSTFEYMHANFEPFVHNPLSVDECLSVAKLDVMKPCATAEFWQKVAAATHARYIVTGEIERVPFAGANPNDPKSGAVAVTVKVVCGDTGKVIGSVDGSLSLKKTQALQDQESAMVMKELIMPQLQQFFSQNLVN